MYKIKSVSFILSGLIRGDCNRVRSHMASLASPSHPVQS